MATILQYEVIEKAYMEKQPRVTTTQNQQLWIIAAVLGPVAFLIIVFWITGFLYYKCISPKNPKNAARKVNPNKPITPKFEPIKVKI
jgi:flagellar biosynthesis/type III secretory pathway M-ring protein FliF/YscJ